VAGRTAWRTTALAVIAYAVAMAYVEAAAVVYLERALGSQVGAIFPLRTVQAAGDLGAIETGREAATLVMLGAVGFLAGRSPLERLAWTAVAFGAWDVGYYAWLWILAGWPGSLATVDLLFLLPVPWAGPVWSPLAVSVALVAVGLAAARALRRGDRLRVTPTHWIAVLAGGLLIVLSYTIGGPDLIGGGLPGPYPWPLFLAGMTLALLAAADVLRRAARPEAASA
jgi:hypothetical protein